jgi:diguanylate cyclase (GGDEF)-like protein
MARLFPRAARGRVAIAAVLVATALVLAGVVAWAAGEEAAQDEAASIEARLGAQLRAASAQFARELEAAEQRAATLAASPRVQQALAQGERRLLRRLAGESGDVAFYADGERLAGTGGWPARRAVSVRDDRGRELGRVVAGVALDGDLAGRLERAAGLRRSDSLAIVRGERVLAGTVPADERPSVADELLAQTGVDLVVSASGRPIDEAAVQARRDAFLAALLTLALLAVLALTTASFLRGRRRTPDEEEAPLRRRAADLRDEYELARRMREVAALVGDALAAGHDRDALLPVILESAVGTTGAVGARLVSDGNEVARAGRPERGAAPLALRLGTEEQHEGLLLLYPPSGASFDAEAGELAQWLAGQASIALENARLHHTVKYQATTDELTELANRRRFRELLGLEVRRAQRFGDSLAVILADLDDFKLVNDRFGHQAGDEVLRRFAAILRATVREIDVPTRYGGEEFAVLLPETGLGGAEQVARRLAAALGDVVLRGPDGEEVPVTASFGVSAYPEAGSAEDLLAAADRALYEAKAGGKNQVARASDRRPGKVL